MASTARRVVSTVPSSFVLRRRRGKEISFRYSGMICCMTVAVVSRLPFEEQNFAVRHVVLSSLSKASARAAVVGFVLGKGRWADISVTRVSMES